MAAPVIQVKMIDGEKWMKVSDHVSDINRYKEAIKGKDTTIINQKTTIIDLQNKLIEKMKSTPDSLFDSIFGGKRN